MKKYLQSLSSSKKVAVAGTIGAISWVLAAVSAVVGACMILYSFLVCAECDIANQMASFSDVIVFIVGMLILAVLPYTFGVFGGALIKYALLEKWGKL